MLKKAIVLIFLCAGVACWSGCGTTTSHFVYATAPSTNQMIAFREDPNSGVLTTLPGSPFPAGNGAQMLVVHPSGKFMYVVNPGNNEDDVSLFTISSGGGLTEVTPRTAVGTLPRILLLDSAGNFLYVGNAGSNNISVFSVGSSGGLTAVSTVPLGFSPLDMQFTPSGSFLYVTGAGNLIAGYTVNSGALTLVAGPYQTGTTPSAIAIDPTSGFLYTANTLDSTISVFTIGASGALSEVSGSPLADPTGPAALLIDPSGKYLIAANQGSGNVSVYTITAGTGFPVAVTGSPFGATSPTSLAFDPNGKYMLVGNLASGIQVFTFDSSTGALNSLSTYGAGGNPSSIGVIQ